MKRKVLQFKGGGLEVLEEEKGTNAQAKDTEEERKHMLQALSLVTELGVSISLPIVGGVMAGVYLDRRFGTAPKLTLGFIFIGLFAGIFQIVRVIKKN